MGFEGLNAEHHCGLGPYTGRCVRHLHINENKHEFFFVISASCLQAALGPDRSGGHGEGGLLLWVIISGESWEAGL